MEIAALPDNEKERLHALYSYSILDTQSEKEFDDLVNLAADICDTPIALISLIDPHRQWFKASVGLGAKETSRDIAFCSHAILQKDILEVEDTFMDRRFYDNPLVLDDPYIRFYAGAQLITPDGYKLGTLCAISDKPKKLNDRQRNALITIASEVIARMELRKKLKQMQLTQQELQNSNQLLNAINQIQHLYIQKTPSQQFISEMLNALLKLTASEYGFIGQVLFDEDQKSHLKMSATSDLAWDADQQKFLLLSGSEELQFTRFNSLIVEVLETRNFVADDSFMDSSHETSSFESSSVVNRSLDTAHSNASLSNASPSHTAPSSGEASEGHSAQNQFAVLPLIISEQFVGIAGIANSEGEYNVQLFEKIKPFLTTCSQLIRQDTM